MSKVELKPRKKREKQPRKAGTVTEISDWYCITEEHILGWINHADESKRLPAINIANTTRRPRWRIKIVDLEAFLAKRSNQAKQTSPRKAPRRQKPQRQYV